MIELYVIVESSSKIHKNISASFVRKIDQFTISCGRGGT